MQVGGEGAMQEGLIWAQKPRSETRSCKGQRLTQQLIPPSPFCFIQALHGSLLLAALLHQEGFRTAAEAKRGGEQIARLPPT